MMRHRLFAAIVLSGLASSRCGGAVVDRDAGGGDDAAVDVAPPDATTGVPDASFDSALPPPGTDAAVDAFVKPPIITH